jgi:diguanylate cyclase (GGDEF)-like protein
MAGKAAKKKLEKLTAIMGRLDWLEAIMRVRLRIGTILELEKISRIYLRELIDMVGCNGCAIIRIDEDKARILAERGFSKTFGEKEFLTDMPAIKNIVDKKEGIFTRNVLSSPFASYVPHGCSINSLICTPIVVNNDVRGIIYLDSLKKNAFSEEDMEFTELLAKEMSISLKQSLEYSFSRNISISDELTGCLNRNKFDVDIVVDVASAEEYREELSLLMVDIDWFRKYNDLHGAEKGDALLKKLVHILTSNTRPYERIYRYGGEEFVILMPDTDKEKASYAARRLQKTIEQAQFEGEKESQPNGTITVSIGIANYPSDANHRDKLITVANSALYRAKESGRNQVCVFNGDEPQKG